MAAFSQPLPPQKSIWTYNTVNQNEWSERYLCFNIYRILAMLVLFIRVRRIAYYIFIEKISTIFNDVMENKLLLMNILTFSYFRKVIEFGF